MPTKPWKEIRAKRAATPPAERARIAAVVREKLRETRLRELREAAGKSQAEVAEASEMSQGEISRIERREDVRDFRLSTLRRYVEALGGKLELVAKFPGKTVVLRPSAD